MRHVVKFGIGLVAIAGLGLAAVQATGTNPVDLALNQGPPPPPQGVVAALADGETFDIRANDQLTRVRLFSIDAPAPATPERPAQCLGQEAQAYLASVIPVGTTLRLTYDKDRFGRTVALASTTDGKLVNAEIVRAGFAEVIRTDDDGPSSSVQAASQEAASNRRGLHSPDVGCTVPGQVKAVVDMAARVPAAPAQGARGADLNNAANGATDARAAADELLWAFEQKRQDMVWLVLNSDERAKLEQQTRAARDKVAAAEVNLRNAASLAFNQEATQRASQAEADRIARQLAAIRAAEARRAAEAARRAEAARQAEAARRAQAESARRDAQEEAARKRKKQQEQDNDNRGSSGSSGSSGSDDSGNSGSSGDSSGSSGSDGDSDSDSGSDRGSDSGSRRSSSGSDN